MASDRRKFLKIAGATVAVAGATLATTATVAQAVKQFNNIKALAFDAYGTLFDVFSVTALCEQLFPGKGTQLAQGRDAGKEALKNDSALYEEIEAAVKAKLDEEKA